MLRTLTVVAALAAGTAIPAGAPVALVANGVDSWSPSEQDRNRGNQGREEQSERTTRTVRIGSNGELDIANVAGDIAIARGDGADARIEMVKTARAQSTAEAREMLGRVQVEVVERSGRAEVRVRHPNENEQRNTYRRNLYVSVAFTITVPAGARVTARSVSGDVSAKDIKGDLILESVSGDVVVSGAGRVNGAKTVSGDVTITGFDMDGTLSASSVSGSVSVRSGKARSLSLSSVSGELIADDVESTRVDMEAVSGDLQWAGPLAQNGRYDLTSHSGNIRVMSANDRGFELDATSFSGTIRSDLPLSKEASQNMRGRRQRSLRGTHGDGSAVLDLTTFSGDIVISKR